MALSRSAAENQERDRLRAAILRFCIVRRTKKEIFDKFKIDRVSGITIGAFLSYLGNDHRLLYNSTTDSYIKPKKKCNCATCRQIKEFWVKIDESRYFVPAL